MAASDSRGAVLARRLRSKVADPSWRLGAPGRCRRGSFGLRALSLARQLRLKVADAAGGRAPQALPSRGFGLQGLSLAAASLKAAGLPGGLLVKIAGLHAAASHSGSLTFTWRRLGRPGPLTFTRRLGTPGPLSFAPRLLVTWTLSLIRWPGGPLVLLLKASSGLCRGRSIRAGRRRARRIGWTAVSLSFIKPGAGILVLSAGPPLAAALFTRAFQIAPRPSRLLRRVPHTPAREPLHHDVRIFSLELAKRGLQLFLVARAKGGGLVVDENGPIGVAGGHNYIL